MPKLPILEPIPIPERAIDQALDIQHDTDPAEDHSRARRIPHLGHAIFFFSLTVLCFALCLIAVLSAAHIHTDQAVQHPGLTLLAEVLAYAVTLLASAAIFSRLWAVPFLKGIQWNFLAARRRWFWIVPPAIVLSLLAQIADTRFPPPPKSPLDAFFHTPLHAWLFTVVGVFLIPFFEEVAFRGFLLPALATAYDWLALERSPAGLRRWETSTAHSTPSLFFAAVFSSLAFALIHGDQLSYSLGPLSVLFTVSLALSYARLRNHSVACSFLLHATYNLTTFATAIIASGGYRHLDRL